MGRSKIEDLPVHEDLDTEEMKGIKGGARAPIGTKPVLNLVDAGVEEGDEIRVKSDARDPFGGDDPGW